MKVLKQEIVQKNELIRQMEERTEKRIRGSANLDQKRYRTTMGGKRKEKYIYIYIYFFFNYYY